MKYAIVLLLSGCSLLPVTAKDKIASGVNDYCKRVTHDERQFIRNDVNAMIAPNSIKVTCAGDPE
jgi:hypothetical protein